MLKGFILNLILGILWGLVGVVASLVVRKKQSITVFYAYSVLIASLFCWFFIARWDVIRNGVIERPWELIICLAVAGFINAFAQWMVVFAMSKGHMAAIWACAQSSLIIPYLFSIFFWQETLSIYAMIGVAILLVGIALTARKDKLDIQPSTNYGWMLPAFAAFLLVGTVQVLMSVPSHWEGWRDSASLRLPVYLTAGTFFHWTVTLVKRLKPTKQSLVYSVCWAGLAITAFYIMFYCLDLMSEFGLTQLVFPVGVGTCIAFFSIYSLVALREKFNKAKFIGILLIIMAIILLGVH